MFDDMNREVSCICVGHKGEYHYDPDCPVCDPVPPALEATPACPACGGETYPLGALGRRAHFRCRACGSDCSERVA